MLVVDAFQSELLKGRTAGWPESTSLIPSQAARCCRVCLGRKASQEPVQTNRATSVNGYRTGISNQITAGDMLLRQLERPADRHAGGLDLMVNPYTASTSGTVRIVALQPMDIAVRHPVSFCHSNDGV